MQCLPLLQVVVEPNETLFETGDDSSSGIFIVLEGAVGVYMHDGDKLMHTNTLRPGESVGDVDILDGRHSTCTVPVACKLEPYLANTQTIACMRAGMLTISSQTAIKSLPSRHTLFTGRVNVHVLLTHRMTCLLDGHSQTVCAPP